MTRIRISVTQTEIAVPMTQKNNCTKSTLQLQCGNTYSYVYIHDNNNYTIIYYKYDFIRVQFNKLPEAIVQIFRFMFSKVD